MDADHLARVVSSSMTVSDKIRTLAAAGMARADIARALGKRYQHVRNVLEADGVRQTGVSPGVAETGAPFSGAQRHDAPDVEERSSGAYRLAVREDGSVVLPDAVRQAFGIEGRGAVMARLEGDEFKLISLATAWKRIDALMAPYRWTGGPLASEELIAERRAEAARESDD